MWERERRWGGGEEGETKAKTERHLSPRGAVNDGEDAGSLTRNLAPQHSDPPAGRPRRSSTRLPPAWRAATPPTQPIAHACHAIEHVKSLQSPLASHDELTYVHKPSKTREHTTHAHTHKT